MALTNPARKEATLLAFLTHPSIEDSYEAYLDSYKRLPSVRARWNGRKPSLAQFKKAFGAKHAKAQRNAERNSPNVSTNDLMAEFERLQGMITNLTAMETDTEPEQDEDDDEDNGFDSILDAEDENDQDAMINRLVSLLSGTSTDETDDDEDTGRANGHIEAKPETPKRVRPENEDALPSSGQTYWYLHRAAEAGQEFAIIPTRRIVAMEGRAMADEGKNIEQIIRALRRKH